MAYQASLRAAKNELRSLMTAKLSQVSAASIHEQSAAVFEAIIRDQIYLEAQNLGIYLSMPERELNTDPIVRHAFSVGKRVFVPYLHKNADGPPGISRVMDMVDLKKLEDYELLGRDKWGIPSLREEQVEGRARILEGQASSQQHISLDLILMPGVAFSTDGESGRIRRLGHGKGFYDFFLARYHRSAQAKSTGDYPFLCGLALREQILQPVSEQQIPIGPLDKLIDRVIVGDGRVIEQSGNEGSRNSRA